MEDIKQIDEEIKKLEMKKKEIESRKNSEMNLKEEVKEFREEHSKEIEVREKEREKRENLIEKNELKKEMDKNSKRNKKKEASFRPIIFIMLASLLIAALWDNEGFEWIKNSVHFVLDPSAGNLLNWNLNWGMLILVVLITLFTTLVQKYATDQKALKELKKEQKELQKKIKEFKHDPKKSMELQKQQMKLMPKQMKLSMRAVAYTGIPFIILFRWFNDYFAKIALDTGEPIKLWLGMSWFIFYLLGAIVLGSILRKRMDVV